MQFTDRSTKELLTVNCYANCVLCNGNNNKAFPFSFFLHFSTHIYFFVFT